MEMIRRARWGFFVEPPVGVVGGGVLGASLGSITAVGAGGAESVASALLGASDAGVPGGGLGGLLSDMGVAPHEWNPLVELTMRRR
jgi:hypothetical protein